jgi:hypothetical protein
VFESALLDECDHVEEGLLYVSVRHNCSGEVENSWIFCLYNGEFIINDSKFSLDVTSPMMQLLTFILFICFNSFSANPIFLTLESYLFILTSIILSLLADPK